VTRRSALIWLFVAGGLVGLALLAIDERMWDEGGPGIVGFELAWTADHADRIYREWGPDGRDAASLSLWLDFVYLVLYSAFWALAVIAASEFAARRGWTVLSFGGWLWPVAVAAGALDFVENVLLLAMLGGQARLAPAAAVFATLKFLALGVVIGYVALVLVRRFPRVAAGLAALGVVAVIVNTWVTDRATEPARADAGGRILELAAGDVHVREDGPRDAPPLVLLHGFGTSVRWWDDVVPALARDVRVVRIDLLGHGGSEKPREGYRMEDQADLVAQVLDALGIRRAAVAGHSMGGAVGTALAQRHRERLFRLMLIGTNPDDEEDDIGLLAQASFWPVVGHANDRLIDDRLVRWTLEFGFAAEFDVPDRLVRDIFERTTWSAYNGSADGLVDFWRERGVHQRLRSARVPLTVLLGEREEQTERSVRLYNTVPGARVVVLEGLDHTPHVEDPGRVVPLLREFARGR
jgi:pimeloyl-ACP methyl ester carboxylesterase